MSHFTVLVIGPDIEGALAPFQENNMGDCPEEYLEFEEDEDASVDSKTGKKGYWRNPNCHWDWYTIGGRWSGYFRLKRGATGEIGEPGVMQKAVTDKRLADSALKGNIDFETMRRQAEERAGKVWDAVNKAIEGTPEHTPWITMHKENIEKAREVYHAQPRVKAFNEYCKTKEGRETIGIFGSVDGYCGPRKKYVELARLDAISTHAFVKDGKWVQSGNMGWFGIVINEKDPQTWSAMFNQMLDGLPDDTLLTVVDCHI